MLYTCINIRIFDRFDLYINDLILNQMFFFLFIIILISHHTFLNVCQNWYSSKIIISNNVILDVTPNFI